jgi:hypothetical protein
MSEFPECYILCEAWRVAVTPERYCTSFGVSVRETQESADFGYSPLFVQQFQSVKFSVFWNVAPCSHVKVDRRFRGAYCLHYQVDE